MRRCEGRYRRSARRPVVARYNDDLLALVVLVERLQHALDTLSRFVGVGDDDR